MDRTFPTKPSFNWATCDLLLFMVSLSTESRKNYARLAPTAETCRRKVNSILNQCHADNLSETVVHPPLYGRETGDSRTNINARCSLTESIKNIWYERCFVIPGVVWTATGEDLLPRKTTYSCLPRSGARHAGDPAAGPACGALQPSPLTGPLQPFVQPVGQRARPEPV